MRAPSGASLCGAARPRGEARARGTLGDVESLTAAIEPAAVIRAYAEDRAALEQITGPYGALQPSRLEQVWIAKRNLEAHGITTSRDDVELVGSAAAGEHYIESDD